jgi:hypothetical protein
VFVDDNLQPYPDQWAFLQSIQPLSLFVLESTIQQASGGAHPLDVAFTADEDEREPWNRPRPASKKLPGLLPKHLTITLANQMFLAKAELSQPLTNRLIRLAAFQNPEFYRAQAMRMPVWNIPRVIGCAENYAQHIALPRGCLDAVLDLLHDNGIEAEIQDKRFHGKQIDVAFGGTLRADQRAAADALLAHDTGILEGAQDAKRQRSEVRRPPRSRRTGCFVGICGSIAGGDKTEGFPIRRRVIVVAMAECVAKRRTEPWRTQDGAGRRRQSVSPFLAPFGDLDVPKGFAKNGDTIARGNSS